MVIFWLMVFFWFFQVIFFSNRHGCVHGKEIGCHFFCDWKGICKQ